MVDIVNGTVLSTVLPAPTGGWLSTRVSASGGVFPAPFHPDLFGVGGGGAPPEVPVAVLEAPRALLEDDKLERVQVVGAQTDNGQDQTEVGGCVNGTEKALSCSRARPASRRLSVPPIGGFYGCGHLST